jgi:hypothetical protein
MRCGASLEVDDLNLLQAVLPFMQNSVISEQID